MGVRGRRGFESGRSRYTVLSPRRSSRSGLAPAPRAAAAATSAAHRAPPHARPAHGGLRCREAQKVSGAVCAGLRSFHGGQFNAVKGYEVNFYHRKCANSSSRVCVNLLSHGHHVTARPAATVSLAMANFGQYSTSLHGPARRLVYRCTA